MHFKPYRYPSDSLYETCGLLSVRKLYFFKATLSLHRTLPFNPDIQGRRRNNIVAHPPMVHTAFARRQYVTQSAYIYNKINTKLDLHRKVSYECKKMIVEWLETPTCKKIEQILD